MDILAKASPAPEGIAATNDMYRIIDWLLSLPETHGQSDELIARQAMHIFKKKVQRDFRPDLDAVSKAAEQFYVSQGRDPESAKRLSRIKSENNYLDLLQVLGLVGDDSGRRIPRWVFRPETIFNVNKNLLTFIAQERDNPKPSIADPDAYRWLQEYRGPSGPNAPIEIPPAEPYGSMHQPAILPRPMSAPKGKKPKQIGPSLPSLEQPINMVARWVHQNCKFAQQE